MSHLFIGSSILITPDSLHVTRTQMGLLHLGRCIRQAKWPQFLLRTLPSWFPHSPAYIYGLFSGYSFSQGRGPNREMLMPLFLLICFYATASRREGNIKKQLIHENAEGNVSGRGLRWECPSPPQQLRIAANTEKTAFSVTVARPSRRVTDRGAEEQTKAVYNQHNQCDISTHTHNARGPGAARLCLILLQLATCPSAIAISGPFRELLSGSFRPSREN